ncbi:MAG: carboxypeptidase regulatory-like domain-containing protein, partial [Chitinophagaceae bacterium]
ILNNLIRYVMNKKQEAKLGMGQAVILHCDKYIALINTLPAFIIVLNAFKMVVSSIRNTVQREARNISGITVDKKELRETLAKQANVLAAVIYSYASASGNNTLKAEVDYTYSHLRNLRDDELGPTCMIIHKAAEVNLVSLIDYNITPPVLDSFKAMVYEYTGIVATPRNATAGRKALNSSLKNLFQEFDTILNERMDTLALALQQDNPEFYEEYKNNRIIVDPGTSPTQAAGTVTIKGNDNTLKGVLVNVEGQEYFTNTKPDGSFKLKIPVPGSYTLLFTKDGYQTSSAAVEIKLGQTATADMELSPVL